MPSAMYYNPRYPDPISVAAHIAGSYRRKHGIAGEKMVDFYNRISEAAHLELEGARRPISLKRAMQLVLATDGGRNAVELAMGKTPDLKTAYAVRLQGDISQVITAPKPIGEQPPVAEQPPVEDKIGAVVEEPPPPAAELPSSTVPSGFLVSKALGLFVGNGSIVGLPIEFQRQELKSNDPLFGILPSD